MVRILDVKTVQSSAFRILIEALKEILTDANLEFDQSGLKIMAMDSSHTVLVHLKLHADNFEHYSITKERVVLGVNMINFFKLIKTMGNSDTLSLFVKEGKETFITQILDVFDNEVVISIKDKSAHSIVLKDKNQVETFTDFLQSIVDKKHRILDTMTNEDIVEIIKE